MMLLMRDIDDDDDDVQKVKCKIVVQNWNFWELRHLREEKKINWNQFRFWDFLSNLFITHVAFSAWLSLIFSFALYDAIILAYFAAHICGSLMMSGMKSHKGRSIEFEAFTPSLTFHINQPCNLFAPKSLKPFRRKSKFDGRKTLKSSSALYVSDDDKLIDGLWKHNS